MHQRLAQAGGAVELAAVILGPPGVFQRGVVEYHRRVQHDGGGREAVGQRRRVQEGLEATAGLAAGLHRAIELAQEIVEATDQCLYRAVVRVQRDEGALHFRQLAQTVAGFGFQQADDVARPRAVGFGEFGPLQALGADLDLLAFAGQATDTGFRERGDHRHIHAADDRPLVELLQNAGVGFAIQGGAELAGGAYFRSAIALALVVVDQRLAQGRHRRLLACRLQRGDHHIAVGVQCFAVLGVEIGAHHLGQVLGLDFHIGVLQRRAHRRGTGQFQLGIGDEFQLVHAAQHIIAAVAGTLGAGGRVVARGRLGQAAQDRHLRKAQLIQRLAEIDLCRRAHAVGAIAQIDFVQIGLEDLFLGQLLLHLQGQQDLLELAGIGALVRQEEIARQLHGDGAAALGFAAGHQQAPSGTQQALVIHAGVLEEAVVFRGQEGAGQILRHLVIAQWCPALGAELADQLAVGGVDPQRHLQRQLADLGYVG